MNFYSINVEYIEDSVVTESSIRLIVEEPLSIRVQGKPYLVIMRTPGKEKEHAVGICLSEGIIDSLDDIASIGCCNDLESNIVTITLTESRRSNILNILERKSYISNTSCGICGKQIVSDMSNIIKPIEDNTAFKPEIVLKNIFSLSNYQPLRKKTKATHCSVIYDKQSQLLSSAEDVGRHNALDKSIGEIFLKGLIKNAKMIVLSSRISYELVQKAARAKIPIVAAISRPTYLAVNLAKKLNITLISLSPNNGLIVHCNRYRLDK